MQAITHLAFGAACAAALDAGVRNPEGSHRRGRLALAATVAALSHPLLDDLARATYHPAQAQLSDPFWLGWHALVWTAAVAVLWWRRGHYPVLLAALIPDLDWLARPLDLWPEGALHGLFRSLPGIASVSEALRSVVPDWRLQPLAVVGEAALVVSLLLLVMVWQRREEPVSSTPGGSLSQP